jgi:predicted transcriptional regulator
VRRLPFWIGGGGEVSDLAYDLIVDVFEAGSMPTARRAERLEVDEADVLRACQELVDLGIIVKTKEPTS